MPIRAFQIFRLKLWILSLFPESARRGRMLSLGATFVEATLTIPIFILFVLFLIDASRLFLAVTTFNYAAYRGADYASKVKIEEDTTVINCATNPSDCTDYYARVWTILDRVLNVATMVASSSNNPSALQLVPFLHYDPNIYNADGDGRNNSGIRPTTINAPTGLLRDACFLRPGEKCQRMTDGTWYEHPKRPFGVVPGTGWPSADENWESALTVYPIRVHVEGKFKFFTWGVPGVTLSGTMDASRRPKKFGAGGPPVQFTNSPVPTATPIPPTKTPGGLFTPGPSPTSTVTSTKTITNTRTSTRTPTSTGTITQTHTITPTTSVTPTKTRTPTSTANCTALCGDPTQWLPATIVGGCWWCIQVCGVPCTSMPHCPDQCDYAYSGPCPSSYVCTAPTPTRTITPTRTPTRTGTPPTSTATRTITPTHTNTYTNTRTYTRTATSTFTITRTSTITNTPTVTPTSTKTPDCSVCTNPSVNFPIWGSTMPGSCQWCSDNCGSCSSYPGCTDKCRAATILHACPSTICENNWQCDPCPTSTATRTSTITRTRTNSPTVTQTYTFTPTATPTITRTSTITPTMTITPTSTGTITNTATRTPSFTPSYTPSITPSLTPTPFNCSVCTCGSGGSGTCCSGGFVNGIPSNSSYIPGCQTYCSTTACSGTCCGG